MCDSRQPLNGADSVAGLALYDIACEHCGATYTAAETHRCPGNWSFFHAHTGECEPVCILEKIAKAEWVLQCAACSLPAQPGESYCAGHLRLGEYTDHERSGGIAANE